MSMLNLTTTTVHDQLDHATSHPWVCPVSVVADVKSSAGFGAVGGLAIDGDVIEVVVHLLVEESLI